MCIGLGHVPHLPSLCILRPQLHLTRTPAFRLDPSSLQPPRKGSSLGLQGVEPDVYIFCLCPHPLQRFEEPEKNLLSLGLSPALLFDGGTGKEK